MSLSPVNAFQPYVLSQQPLVGHSLFPEVFPSLCTHSNMLFWFPLVSISIDNLFLTFKNTGVL